jgi:hypothetical protein
MFFKFTRTGRWLGKFQAAHPYLSSSAENPGALRLILGASRSGTSWVSQVFSKMSCRCRFFSEPLFHLTPRLPFHKQGDHTAMGYEPVSGDHPLLWGYRLAAHRQFDGSGLKVMYREDADWKVCLVKEVHALLGSEGLLSAWRTPTLFIMRDPVYVVDSLFAAQGLETIYFDHEVKAVQAEGFLERFAPGRRAAVERVFADAAQREQRLRIVLEKVICTQLIHEMFAILAKEFPCAKAMRYEEFCERPREAFQLAAAALSITWDDGMEAYLRKTMQADGTSEDPYSIMRNTAEQKARPFKFLSGEERLLCQSVLEAMAA